MTDFDLTASYVADYELIDFVETGEYVQPADGDDGEGVEGLKVLRFDATHPAVESIAVGLGLDATDTVLIVWNPQDLEESNSLQPRIDGQIVLDDATWVIRNFRLNRFGHFEMGVNKARANADA